MAAGRDRALAEVYRQFGEHDAAANSPLYRALATAIAASPPALDAIGRAPSHKQHPTLILAALHDLALRGDAVELADAYAARDADAAVAAAIALLVTRTDAVVALATRRQTQTNETGRCAVLRPAIAEAAHRLGAASIGLVDVGCSAGLNLQVDRVGITYSTGEILGDAGAPLPLTCALSGSLPVRPMPDVVARIGVDLDPIDVTKADDARWLRACLWPDQPERVTRLEAAIALAAADPPTLLAGDAVELLPDALARVPDTAVPVVTTTWALSYFSLEARLRFLRRLDEAAASRPLAWVSMEGVGIAPAVPTRGDSRLASHSVVGIATAHGGSFRVDAVARCHPHGSWMEWLG